MKLLIGAFNVWILFAFDNILLADTLMDSDIQAPNFIQEPPSRLIFGNQTGSQVSCLVHGKPSPIVTWHLRDGTIINGIPGLRQTIGNGTLYFPPFRGQYFRSDIHETIYRCKASNLGGTILSRDISVRAVVQQPYEVKIEGKDVIAGNVAYLHCTVTEHTREFVAVKLWFRDDEKLMLESSDIGGRYIVTSGVGDLYIRNIRSEDSLKKFSCLTVNSLTKEEKLSDPIYLNINDLTANTAPRSIQKAIIEMHVNRGTNVHLPCNVQGNPPPVFTWLRVSDSGATYPIPPSQRVFPSQSILFIKHVDDRDAGRWICKVSNQYGEIRLETHLVVNSYLTAHIHPQKQIVNSGATAVFNCSITGGPFESVEWFHNGLQLRDANSILDREDKIKLLSPVSLTVNSIAREDKGIYQCIVSNKKSSAQAFAELKLGDTMPELLYTFIEQNVRPGQHISLKCSASGSPPPQFTWLLDSQPIIDVSSLHRYAIGQYVDSSGDVIGHLNISHVRPDDGGLYRCIAGNSIGNLEHSARLNVYGPPYIRATGPVKAVAGNDIFIQCPFSGYPIETIRWEKHSQEIISNDRYTIALVQNGGALKISQIDASHDEGIYTCIVRSRTGEEARRDIQIIINSPPVIEAFNFPKNLPEGGFAQVACSVSTGDMPIFFNWHKDGAPIPLSLQVQEKKDEFFTQLVFKEITARHSGTYTCFATNTAAKTNRSAELLVKVQPQWRYEPKDMAVMLGNSIIIHCEADGYPEPKISWFRGQGKVSKDFKQLNLRNNTLIVDYATASDEGFYMCQANNNIGTGLKKVIHINVNEPARFEIPSRNVSARRNDPIVLSCNALGDEQINVIWSHQNERIDLHNYRFNIAELKTETGVTSQLSISRSDRQDSGKYKCIAENPFGRSEHLIYLAVQERPDSPANLEIIEVTSRTVKLSWRRPFDGNSPVLSYLVQHQALKQHQNQFITTHNNGEWNSPYTVNLTLPTISDTITIDGDPREQAVVTGLHPATTYLMRMLAVNEIEKSSFTDPIVIKTQEEAPHEAPHTIQVQTGGMGELIVSWREPLRDTWNGELLGYIINCTEEKQNINFITTNTSTKTITIHGYATTKATISNLRKYTRYAISVRAFNGFAAGPYSAPIIGTTLEGVPEAAPQNVSCKATSSKSIKISWHEPPLQFHGGIILGYKVLYRPLSSELEYSSSTEVKRTSNIDTYLHALYKATNYSLRVLAYTSSGDGISSAAIFCATEEDVPDAPANIKGAALTADSILISWLQPIHRNGIIDHYTVYSREVGRKGQPKTTIVRVDENGRPTIFEARNLNENQKYEYWVTASTSVGEGEPTQVIVQATNTRAPARIASFSRIIKCAVGSTQILECHAVGNPTPRTRWFTRDRPVTFSSFYEVTPEGNLKIHSVELNLSGNYTCSAKNLFGEDEIIYTVVAMSVPLPPKTLIQYVASDSIRISWDGPEDSGGAPIDRYSLSYRAASEAWTKVDLGSEQNAMTLAGLKCGTQYYVKMAAHNKVGEGHANDEMPIGTKGKPPIAPDEKEFIQTNATCLQVLLSLWNDGGCQISHFSIEHRALGEIRWTVVSSYTSRHEEPNDRMILCDFLAATWYQLRISATNDAGKTVAQYNFATTRMDGESIPLPKISSYENNLSPDVIIMGEDTGWLSTVSIGGVIIVGLIFIVFMLWQKGALCGPISDGYESRVIANDVKEERDNHRNQQVYTASPVKTVDKGNESEMYEISPYATFSVSGGRTVIGQGNTAKTPTRGVTTSTLDYTMQFKTFGHPEGDNLNATAYPILPSSGFGHVKGKSSWHKQRYYNTDDESLATGASGSHLGHKTHKTVRDNTYDTRIVSRNKIKTKVQAHSGGDSESDTSGSPTHEFSNAPTYRIPIKSTRDSSTESNADNSPIHERRTNTPRHITSSRSRSQQQQPLQSSQPLKAPRETISLEVLRPGSNNR